MIHVFFTSKIQVDDPIAFTQLTVTDDNASEENRLEASLLAATGVAAKKKEEEDGQTKLSKVRVCPCFRCWVATSLAHVICLLCVSFKQGCCP